ncbi:MAG: PspA/IM30 family protein, partial [Myxococcota bacterium]
GVVDAIEDKGLLLKQALREAHIALDTKRAESESLRGRAKDTGALLERMREEAEALDADIELALEQEQEDLARYAARKLLPLRQRIADAERGLSDLDEQRAELDALIERQARDLEELELRVKDYLHRAERGETLSETPISVSDEEVELELLRRRRKGGA